MFPGTIRANHNTSPFIKQRGLHQLVIPERKLASPGMARRVCDAVQHIPPEGDDTLTSSAHLAAQGSTLLCELCTG